MCEERVLAATMEREERLQDRVAYIRRLCMSSIESGRRLEDVVEVLSKRERMDLLDTLVEGEGQYGH
jgi:hypothetical protein